MKKTIFLIVAILLILTMVFWLKKDQFSWPGKKMETAKVCFVKPEISSGEHNPELSSGEHCFLAEVASTETQRAKGLMFRENLPKDKAMLFVFLEKGVYNFWMKNCKIPLDIIFLDENKRVVAIKENCQPCGKEDCPSIQPGVLAKYVLEISAGLADEMGLAENAHLTIDYLD